MFKAYTADGREKNKGQSFAPQGVVCQTYAANNYTASGVRKVTLDTKAFDPFGFFDTTNSRFQPRIPGYYDVSAIVDMANPAGTGWVMLYKNGNFYCYLGGNSPGPTSESIPGGSTLVYLNGTTDYVEVWVSTTGSTTIYSSVKSTQFNAALVASSVGVAPEPWHVIGAAGEPAFQNGWQNQPGYPTAAFMKDPHGFVRLRGTIYGAAATANPAFTLPSGYRPAGEIDVAVVYVPTTNSDGASAVIQVKADGTVNPLRFVGYGTSAFSNTMRYVDLNAVNFRAEQ